MALSHNIPIAPFNQPRANPMLSDEEIRQNLFDVKNAIAQQRIEGLMPSHEVVSELERVAHGEMTVREVIANIGNRHRDAKIRRQRPLS